MRVLVKAMVCLKDSKGTTAQEKRKALVQNMAKGKSKMTDITLQLSTFIIRALQLTKTLTPNVLEIIVELQNDINFHEIVGVLVKQNMDSEIFTLALSSKLSDETRNQIAYIALHKGIEAENFPLAIELW